MSGSFNGGSKSAGVEGDDVVVFGHTDLPQTSGMPTGPEWEAYMGCALGAPQSYAGRDRDVFSPIGGGLRGGVLSALNGLDVAGEYVLPTDEFTEVANGFSGIRL